jgi:hypothetical protein
MVPGRQPPMSRRHHGNRPHRSSGQPRPTDPVRSGPDAPAAAADPGAWASRPTPGADVPSGPKTLAAGSPALDRPIRALSGPESARPDRGAPVPVAQQADLASQPHPQPDPAAPIDFGREAGPGRIPTSRRDDHGPAGDVPPMVYGGRGPGPDSVAIGAMASCTAPQLRRFIKSRPYVPMHELRRRFGINGTEDDVSSIDLGQHRVYVGLPPREGSLLGELLRGGDIGFELSLDPRTPIVIGLYPMRPVART